MTKQPIMVVVPCFNEESRLKLQQFRSFAVKHAGIGFLFVDDGSTDATRTLLTTEREAHPQFVELLPLEENFGKGEAVRLGLLLALEGGSEFVAYWDADLATPLEELTGMLKCFEDRPEASCVIGSRVRLLGRSIERQASRHYLGRVFASVASLVLRMPVYDTQCGAKIFRATQDLRLILDRPFRSKWIFDVELLARLKAVLGQNGEKGLIEYPLQTWRDIGGSKLKIRDFVRAAYNLFDLWLRTKSRHLLEKEGGTDGE